MIAYHHMPLRAGLIHVGGMASIQSVWPRTAYIRQIKRHADRDATLIVALDRYIVVGSLVMIPGGNLPFVRDNFGDAEHMAVRTAIFTAPSRQGQGVNSEIQRLADELAAAQGFTHWLDYGYATAEIASHLQSRPGARDSGLKDPQGSAVYTTAIAGQG